METAAAAEPFRFHAGTSPPVAAGESVAGTDALVRETRREIASIVRETALLAQRERSVSKFFSALVDRVARAMAAEGAVIWQRVEDPPHFRAIARVGQRTDRDLPTNQIGCHQALLRQIAVEQQPAVVPPTPGADDDAIPANPSDVPVAVVPIFDPTAESVAFLLEVFLEPEGGPATQRGYLRFAAQMADLAADFLRLHQIRQSRQAEARWQRISASLPRLHHSLRVHEVAARIVDETAELFDVDRVSLCSKRGRSARLLAVSHVAQPQRKNDEAKRIEACAAQIEPAIPRFHEESDEHALPTDDPPSALPIQAAIVTGSNDHYVLVLQAKSPVLWNDTLRADLHTFAAHAGDALRNANTFEAVPWAPVVSSLAATTQSRLLPAYRQWVMVGLLVFLLAVIACFPLPLIVQSEGELYAAHAQTIYAPRDGVVSEVLVEHGDTVSENQVLLRITDPLLEQQYESLVGERAVLLQRAAELRGGLLDQSTRRGEESRRLQAEQRIVDEKIGSIDRQLVLLESERGRLTLRSDRQGIVDGWQIQRQLLERPVGRGDPLLSVIEPQGPWRLEARLPQNRVDLVLAAMHPANTDADSESAGVPLSRVALASAPEQPLFAKFDQLGPITDQGAGETPIAKASFLIANQALPPLQTGAPATVAIDCGYRPLLFVAFQDLIRTLTGKVRMYL